MMVAVQGLHANYSNCAGV